MSHDIDSLLNDIDNVISDNSHQTYCQTHQIIEELQFVCVCVCVCVCNFVFF